jgi:spermidine synthase
MRNQTVFETWSPISGRVRVVDAGGQRRLVVAGDTLSAYPLSGDWSAVRREYWGRALDGLRLPPRTNVLFVGLGGGTQIHLLHQMTTPRSVTVIERDPVIVRVARDWFGLRALRRTTVLTGDAEGIVRRLLAGRRRFGLVVEDATYAEKAERSLPLLRSLVRLVSREGILIANRHFRRDARLVAAEMRRFFRQVTQRRVRREAENVVVRCVGRATLRA